MSELKIRANTRFIDMFIENGGDIPFFSEAVSKFSQKIIYEVPHREFVPLKQGVYTLNDVPEYLEAKLSPFQKKIKTIKVDTYIGFLNNLAQYKDFEEYQTVNFSKSKRSQFRTFKKRLEICFPITYTMYYGAIDKEEYDRLFDYLEKMTKDRFLEKQMVNEKLGQWDYYHRHLYSLVLAKKACIFVVYNGKIPIAITLNLVYGRLLVFFIKSFDTDYTKFSIGFTDWAKQMEWSFEQGFELFDMLKGDLEYKRKLTDTVYKYQRYYLYDSKSLSSTLKAHYSALKTKIFYQLLHLAKRWNLHLVYRKYNKKKYLQKNGQVLLEHNKPWVANYLMPIPKKEKLTPVDLNTTEYSFLKRHVYTFLYSAQENIKNIQVFKVHGAPDSYFVQGLKKNMGLTCQ